MVSSGLRRASEESQVNRTEEVVSNIPFSKIKSLICDTSHNHTFVTSDVLI